MQNMEIAHYNCTQQELYIIGRKGWKNYDTYFGDFTSFKLRYTQKYGQDRLGEILAAQKMQTNNANSGTSTKSNVELGVGAAECMIKWQNLKRYILDVYTGPVADAMLKAAGQSNYLSASNNNWASVETIMNEGAAFIESHTNELVANENMPPNFVNDFAAAQNGFITLYDQYLGDSSNTTVGGQERIIANNAIYDTLAKMLQDGQQIFVKNEGVRQQFIFSNLKAMVSGVGQAGLRGIITDAITNLPIVAATVATANNLNVVTTDDAGRFDLLGLPAGDYILTITAVGYVAQTLQATIKTGTVSTLNVGLELVVVSI